MIELIEINNKSEVFENDKKTYDLEVENDHSYNINGVIVHNSACLTRIKTGVGVPQLSAVMECADAAHGLGGYVCADGGITCAGDVSKAFGAGADFVMIGGLFAAHDECGGEIFTKKYRTNEIDETGKRIIEEKKFMKFYGMSSEEAMNIHMGGVKEYRSSEGKTTEILYRGSVKNTIHDILGGLRSTLTYTGSKKLKELPKRCTFIRVSQQSNEIYGKN